MKKINKWYKNPKGKFYLFRHEKYDEYCIMCEGDGCRAYYDIGKELYNVLKKNRVFKEIEIKII